LVRNVAAGFLAVLALIACAAPYDPRDDYETLESTTILEAPEAQAGNFAPANKKQVDHGRYMVELLGCGSCHTEGALEGSPDRERALAGSGVGIAYTNPLEHRYPGVVYPSNITPDTETGIGGMSDSQIASAIRSGVGRHGGRALSVMPWQGYARMSEEDVAAIVAYLRSIAPIRNEVPATVLPGTRAPAPYVHFGVYRDKR
jgi:mono/diheme cytochrome c family protein